MVVTFLVMKISVFWVNHAAIRVVWHFFLILLSNLMMEATYSSETPVFIHRATWDSHICSSLGFLIYTIHRIEIWNKNWNLNEVYILLNNSSNSNEWGTSLYFLHLTVSCNLKDIYNTIQYNTLQLLTSWTCPSSYFLLIKNKISEREPR